MFDLAVQVEADRDGGSPESLTDNSFGAPIPMFHRVPGSGKAR